MKKFLERAKEFYDFVLMIIEIKLSTVSAYDDNVWIRIIFTLYRLIYFIIFNIFFLLCTHLFCLLLLLFFAHIAHMQGIIIILLNMIVLLFILICLHFYKKWMIKQLLKWCFVGEALLFRFCALIFFFMIIYFFFNFLLFVSYI